MHIATLGPSGNNHELIALRYLNMRCSGEGSITLFTQFEDAFKALINGQVSHVLQCTAHFSHSDCVGRFMHRAYPVDTFIAGSKPLALIAQRALTHPTQIALQPATRYYTDLTGFEEIIEAPTTVAVAEGLLSEQFEAGICAEEVLAQAPEQLRLVQSLGPALDTWVMFATTPLPLSSPLRLDHEDDNHPRHY
ncbi:hypothetical protein LCGC14_0185270 [marine sediment metagenome]|uniref:Uncharacterized protein n=1 Tax=marine sediment metagenome TaxID=412755 RepID=A0A0F9X6X4_9ZZZZ|nr:hypothetical protein [Halomonas sp.]HDZ49279.1 hypothetical protein [Halomonas sp.]HEB05125.1 hypothetical protein [Halomonas sp.]